VRAFPPSIPRQKRVLYGLAGILAVLVLWWGLTFAYTTEQTVRRERVPTGEVETGTHPVTGEPIEVPVVRLEEHLVERPRALVNPPALDTPWNTASDAWRLLTTSKPHRPNLLQHLWSSTFRVVIGFFISSLFAVPLGIMMGLFPRLRATISPIVSFLRPLPSISWVPLAMIWLGAGEMQKLAIIFMGTFSAALIYTIEATIKVDPDLIRAARNLGANDRQLLRRVLLPAALPNIVSGLKVVLAIGWTCVISAEIVGTTEGLGALIWLSKETSNTSAVLVGMACISGVVLLLDVMTTRVERLLLPYLFLREGA